MLCVGQEPPCDSTERPRFPYLYVSSSQLQSPLSCVSPLPSISSSRRPFPQVLLLSERRGEEGRQHVVRVQHGPRRQHGQGKWRVLCGMCCVVGAVRYVLVCWLACVGCTRPRMNKWRVLCGVYCVFGVVC